MKKYSIKSKNISIELNEIDLEGLKSVEISKESHLLRYQNKTLNAKIISANHAEKKYAIKIDHQLIEIEIKSELDQYIEQLGFSKNNQKKVTEILSPMPGLVLDILVDEGEHVTENTLIIILEAMKMENSIKIPNNAIIDKIFVKKGQAVEKGHILIKLKDKL